LWLRADGEGVGLSPLLVGNGGGIEVVKATSQTQKRNNSKQIVPANPVNNAQGWQTKDSTADWFVVGMEPASFGKAGCLPSRPFCLENLKFIMLKNGSYL